MNRKQLEPIVTAVRDHADEPALVSAAIWEAVKDDSVKPGWRLNMMKLALFCDLLVKGDAQPSFTIFAEGNSKLPFLSFSAMPGFGFCPGSGDCRDWCYSFSAWRYPAAFCRQVQNTVLLSTDAGRFAIADELRAQLRRPKYRDLERVDFRLYVDGDFRDVLDVHFWMSQIKSLPQLAAYGYSKSFTELLGYDVALSAREGLTFAADSWPRNYVLNVSSGHRHSPEVVEAVERLPITRGRFIAVAMPTKARHSDHSDRDHQQALRSAYGAKAFTCPGECGTCTPTGHACGSERFHGVDIIIAAH
jgi:hypothetical protein